MSDASRDKGVLEAASDKVQEVGAAAAEMAKEKAAHLQPGGSQVGKVSSDPLETSFVFTAIAVQRHMECSRQQATGGAKMQVVQEKSDGSEKKVEKERT